MSKSNKQITALDVATAYFNNYHDYDLKDDQYPPEEVRVLAEIIENFHNQKSRLTLTRVKITNGSVNASIRIDNSFVDCGKGIDNPDIKTPMYKIIEEEIVKELKKETKKPTDQQVSDYVDDKMGNMYFAPLESTTVPKPTKPNLIDTFDKNWEAVVERDKKSKEQGFLLGRYIDHPYADGCAFYKIAKVSKSKVTVEVITGIGDDYQIPAWGSKAVISRTKAEQFLEQRDSMAIIFNGKTM